MTFPLSGSRLPQPILSSIEDIHVDTPTLRAALQLIDGEMQYCLALRDIIAKRLSSRVAALSPIHRLPDELLAKCFAMGVKVANDCSEPFPGEAEDPLFCNRLLLVSRHWNHLACDTPSLWSAITISSTHSIGEAKRRVSRAKAVPLDITIDFPPRLSGSSAGEPVMRAMELVSPYISHWRTFWMNVPNRVHANSALKLCTATRAPLLEAFSVQISNVMQDDHYASPPRNLFVGYAPRMRTCNWTAFDYEGNQGLLKGLRVLKLGGYWNSCAPSGLQLRQIFESCPGLEELSLKNLTDIDPDCDDLAAPNARRLPRISLSKLHTLSLYYAGIVRATLILESTSFPALQNVELAFLDNISPVIQALEHQALSTVTAMNLPVGLPLQRLRIESCYFNELRLAGMLKRTPTLEHLELVDLDDLSANFLQCLSTPPRSQVWIAPQLEHLSLEGCTAASINWSSLSKLIESRIPSQTMHRHHNARSYASASANVRQRGDYLGGDLGPPRRLRALDLTRCIQFSREQLQWFRMYVHDVRSDAGKGAST